MSSSVGRYGTDIVNQYGTRLIGLCESYTLPIVNGFFAHKELHKYTWQQTNKEITLN